MTYAEIPWPVTEEQLGAFKVPSPLGQTEYQVGCFYVFANLNGEWCYARAGVSECLGIFETALDAVNEGALRDDYRG